MKASWGKVRIGVIALLGVLAFAMLGVHRSSRRAYSSEPPATLFVTDHCSNAVTAYPASSKGDVSPLSPAPTGLSEPVAVALDKNGNIYAINQCTTSITIYAKGSSGDAAPIATIGGSNTGLSQPTGIALDSSSNIYVTDEGATSVFVYPPVGLSTGPLNEAPTATISGSNTGLSFPEGITLDSSDNIYVADEDGSVFVYPPLGSSTGSLNEAPTATISGTNTGLHSPIGVALDSSKNIYVADNSGPDVFVYPALGSSTGTLNEAPTATIGGSNTQLEDPQGIALDSTNNIYVTDFSTTSVHIYPPVGSSTGTLNEAPKATIVGPNTGLSNPTGVALDAMNKIYVTDGDVSSVFVYQALGSSTGTLNEAPIDTIDAAATIGAVEPTGIAVDSLGRIYVADPGTGSVFVYPVGSNANTAPTATISGSNTGLEFPIGIALDSDNNIYVTDGNLSVLIFPPIGSSTGLLNEAPTATISGSNTGLTNPQGIALDSSRNIYVADINTPSLFIYPPIGSSTGTLNEAPTATISGSNTGLSDTRGIALDSSGNIYAANEFANITVYPPLGSSTGTLNEAPTATITSASLSPFGIVLDSSDNIYVASEFSSPPNVSMYPPLGSSTGTINEPPTTTISGPQTELGEPLYVAILPATGPTPTATSTGSATASATRTATATSTGSATASATRTATATSTGSATASATRTATATSTGSATASATRTATATSTGSATASATPTATATSTGSATATATRTATATSTGSATATATRTATATSTGSATATATRTATATATVTATATATRTATATSTGSATATATRTATATATVTATATATRSATATATVTATATHSATATATVTATPTATPTGVAMNVAGSGTIAVGTGNAQAEFVFRVPESGTRELIYENPVTGDMVESFDIGAPILIGTNMATFSGVCVNMADPCTFTVTVTGNQAVDRFAITGSGLTPEAGNLTSGSIQITP
jgi:hypothetical protein